MTTKQNKSVTIIGAGLGGSFLALLLANRGYEVDLYEKLSRNEICDSNSKRSYNITFRGYGIDMLKKAGLWNDIKPSLLPLRGASTQLSKNTKPIISLIRDKRIQYFAVSRSELLNVILQQLSKHSSVTTHFKTTILSIDRHDKTITIQNDTTQKITTVSCNVIIGADGVNSIVRLFLQQGQHTHHTQDYSKGGYKQFAITNKQVKELGLEADIAYTWSSKDKFVLAFPNLDGSLASLLIYPTDRKAFDSLKSNEAIHNLFKEDFPHLVPVQKDLSEQLLHNPEGSFVTIHTDPWFYKDFITLIGDAAHGFYPFFGQGTTAAFGDAMMLAELVDKYGPDWDKIFPLYQQGRKKHMDALGELSKNGLIRYTRNKRADYDTIYDTLESMGHAFFPKYIRPAVSQSVMSDPGKTADYVEQHEKQRTLAKNLGISFAIAAGTKLLSIYERFAS